MPRRPIYADEKIFGPLTLVWVVRILLGLAIVTLAIFAIQLVQINNAAHSREELRNSICVLIVAADPKVQQQPLVQELAAKDDCKVPGGSATPTPSPTK